MSSPFDVPRPPADAFARFAAVCEALAASPSRISKRGLIADYLISLAPDDAARATHYLIGSPFAECDPRTLNIGSSILWTVIAQLSHAGEEQMHAAYRRHGDLGAAAHDLFAAAELAPLGHPLTLAFVADAFDQLAPTRNRVTRLRLLQTLFRAATPLEAKYLVKIILGDMRTGVKQSLVEEGIASAYNEPLADIRRGVLFTGDLGAVLHRAADHTLDSITPTLFHPLGFMLASPVSSTAEVFARLAAQNPAPKPAAAKPVRKRRAKSVAALEPALDELIAVATSDVAPEIPAPEPPAAPTPRKIPALHIEDKFDGMRAQIHCGDPTQPARVAIYSRNREDVTATFPELAHAFAAFNEPCILDGEILGWDHATSRALPFVTFANRLGRKRVSPEMLLSTPVAFVAFDCLFAQGHLLFERPLSERRAILTALLDRQPTATSAPIPTLDAADSTQATLFETPAPAAHPIAPPAPILLAHAAATSSPGALDKLFELARERGNEGLVIKDLASRYTPGRRGLAWLKLKRELATLDVVVTGVERGHGRRAAVLSDYTFAVRDGDKLLNVGKAYSGLTDLEITELTQWFEQHTLEDNGYFRTVEPQIILEVAFNNIMRSGRHNSGFALRFPRILRLRTDKPVTEIDTLARVEEIYNSQPDKPAE